MNTRPIRFGLAGLGGFAGYACDRLLDAGSSAEPPAELITVLEPQLERFGRRVEQLRGRGVRIARSYRQLLDMPIDAVWLPLPIHLHRPYTECALRAGKAVLCEKPAAGCVDDVDAMIAARVENRKAVLIGFQDVYQPCVSQLKRRLLRGDLGAPLSASVIGCWPRDVQYFSRNNWVGKLRHRGRWVMDSPAGNALAHFLHLALFLLGPRMNEPAYPLDVAAELYRANSIESFDTCALRYTVGSRTTGEAGAVHTTGAGRNGDNGDTARRVSLVAAFTHACDVAIEPEVTIECEGGSLRYLAGRHAELRIGMHVEIFPLDPNPHARLLSSFHQHLVGQDGDGTSGDASGAATLESARAHVVAVGAAAEATEIVDVPPQFVTEVRLRDGAAPTRAIRGVAEALRSLVANPASAAGELLHDRGAFPWTHPAGSKRISADYHHFAGPCGGTSREARAGAVDAGRSAVATLIRS